MYILISTGIIQRTWFTNKFHCYYSCVLRRFGIKTKLIDSRPEKVSLGKADGIQPKSLETFEQLGLLERLLPLGVKVYDITFWKPDGNSKIQRFSREVHFPAEYADLRRPYILLTHQGMVEGIFLDDISLRGSDVDTNTAFESYSIGDATLEYPVRSTLISNGEKFTVESKYVVGCDGAHSKVRKSMPNSKMEGESSDSSWGVIDGVLDTDFPDFWTKTVIKSADAGSVLGIPRERNLTRLYIELEQQDLKNQLTDENMKYVQQSAKKIMAPYRLEWKSVEWFGIYSVGQRVATSFSDRNRAFIVGDASHTHSPKAAQGLNVSIHDAWNLGWKISQVLKGYAPDSLLDTYELERKKIGQDLINFDKVHAKAFDVGDQVELAKNFQQNVQFISGVGATYGENVINQQAETIAKFVPGQLPCPANVERFIDSNPISLETATPIIGQYNLVFMIGDYKESKTFLESFNKSILADESYIAQLLEKFPTDLKEFELESDKLIRQRYTPVSELFTVSTVAKGDKYSFEIAELPKFFSTYEWSVYIESCSAGPSEKWTTVPSPVTIFVIRPDGYCGTLKGFDASEEGAIDASTWIQNYFKAITSLS